ncbi:hypothetical protein [Niveispirillum sp. KHB5.9]|uniref:hypothetical protein n=1 Tax=Niveispirillum sp. KHB5.9 TaxID=3400269 RepID=UPI003A8448C0
MTRQAPKSLETPLAARGAEVGAEISTTALVLGETLWAAQQTIWLRVMRLGAAGIDPTRLKDPEITRMVWEKLDAALEAQRALASGLWALSDVWFEWLAQQITAAAQAGMEMAAPPDPIRYGGAASDYVETSLNAAEIACGRMALEATRLGGRGLAPYHRATNENAKRLMKAARRRVARQP